MKKLKMLLIASIILIAAGCTKTEVVSPVNIPVQKASKLNVAGIWNYNKDYPIVYEAPIFNITNTNVVADTTTHLLTYSFKANNVTELSKCVAVLTKNGTELSKQYFDLQVGSKEYLNNKFTINKFDKNANYTVMLYIK